MTARIFIYLLFVGGCLSCSPPAAVQATSEAAVSDPFELLDARVEGDALVVRVEYSGGGQHDFALVSSGAPTKSIPRQVLLEIRHDSQGDLAKAMIIEERTFDLTPYSDPKNNEVHLRIQGVDDVIVYRYAP